MRGLAALAILALMPAARAEWIRLRTPHLEVLTDAGERAGRQALERLEQIRQVLPLAAAERPLDLRVWVFANESEFRGFAPNRAAEGFFQSGLDRHFIVTHRSAGLSRVVVHEYVHFLLHSSGHRLPNWIEEGLAEFYSNLSVERDKVRIGGPLDAHLALLKREAWLDVNGLLSPPAAEDSRRRGSLYYAQSWAFAHMLHQAPEYSGSFSRFIDLLDAGRDDREAFQEAFGRGMEEALDDLRAYVSREPGASEADAPALAAASPSEPAAVSDLDSRLLRGELALRTGRMDTARPLFEDLAREHPEDGFAQAGLGTLALASGDRDLARRRLERALELDPRNAAIWFQYALLEQDAGTAFDRVSEMLKRAVELNPDIAQAHLLLGVRATDDGRLAEAVDHLRQAARLLPSASHVWNALAYAEQRSGAVEAARSAARQALRTAASQQEAGMAHALLDSLETSR